MVSNTIPAGCTPALASKSMSRFKSCEIFSIAGFSKKVRSPANCGSSCHTVPVPEPASGRYHASPDFQARATPAMLA